MRDVERLREMGTRISAATVPDGGYRLEAGADLPPLLFDDEQAVAIAVALSTSAYPGSGIEEGAFLFDADIEVVEPPELADAFSVLALRAARAHSRSEGPRMTFRYGGRRNLGEHEDRGRIPVTDERVEVTRTADGVTVRARVSPEHAEMAETVLSVMMRDGLGTDPETGTLAVEKGIDRLRRETPMWWGFAEATPRAVADGYELVTPDFHTDPPVRTDDLTPMLDIRDKMQRVMLEARAGEEPTRASDRVLLTRGWEDARVLVMIRDEPHTGDSGWFIQDPRLRPPEGGWAADDLVAVHAWTLLRDRPELVWAMSLPVGYVVKTEPGRIVEAVDANDAVVLRDIVL